MKKKQCSFCGESYPEENVHKVKDIDGEMVYACEWCIS